MGLLIDGVWRDQWYDTGKTGGRFVRSESRCAASALASWRAKAASVKWNV